MTVLTRQEKKNIASPWVRKVFQEAMKTADLNLADLEPAIQAVEDVIESTGATLEFIDSGVPQASKILLVEGITKTQIVAVLPEPFKSKTNGAEKTLLFVYVAMKRAGLI